MSETGVCGSYAGWQRHRRRGEAACLSCMEAKRIYSRAYYRRNPRTGVARELQRARGKARDRALSRLAREYPARFLTLLSEERESLSKVVAP